MTKTHKQLVLAAFAGLLIAGAAALAIQPALAFNARPQAVVYLAS